MKRRLMTLLSALAFIVTILLGTGIGAEQKETVTIDSIKDKQGPVTLKHKAHIDKYGLKCIDCHHKTKEGETPKACKSCHDPKEKKGDKVNLKNAYHKGCKGCHKEKAKKAEEGKKPPTKCKECHEKKKK